MKVRTTVKAKPFIYILSELRDSFLTPPQLKLQQPLLPQRKTESQRLMDSCNTQSCILVPSQTIFIFLTQMAQYS